jgi:hypothetical protein
MFKLFYSCLLNDLQQMVIPPPLLKNKEGEILWEQTYSQNSHVLPATMGTTKPYLSPIPCVSRKKRRVHVLNQGMEEI